MLTAARLDEPITQSGLRSWPAGDYVAPTDMSEDTGRDVCRIDSSEAWRLSAGPVDG